MKGPKHKISQLRRLKWSLCISSLAQNLLGVKSRGLSLTIKEKKKKKKKYSELCQNGWLVVGWFSC